MPTATLRTLTLLAVFALIVAACSSGDDVTAVASSTTAPPATASSIVDPTTTAPSEEPYSATVTVTGPEETVYAWSTDRCDDFMYPDLPVRAFRTADGNVNLTLADPNNFRLIGPDFDSLVATCPAIFTSAYDPDPSQYSNFQWIAATYTEDGSTIYAVIHNEFHGDLAAAWDGRRDFSLTQGERDWSYLARSTSGTSEMAVVEAEWRASGLCSIVDWGVHPEVGCNPVRRWTAPRDGLVIVDARVKDVGQGGGNGVEAGIDGPDGQLWSTTIEEGAAGTRRTALSLDLLAGDNLDFWVDARGDSGFDATNYKIQINYDQAMCSGERGKCQQISLTSAVSVDGGMTWSSKPAPENLVATVPVKYVPDAGLAAMWQPSDIVKNPNDDYYYMLVQYNFHRDGINVQGECLLRTATLDDASSWRAWDGTAFEMTFLDPYTNPDLDPAEHTCPSVVDAPIGGLTYNTYLERFVAIAGYGVIDPVGIYLVTSEDLINWTEPQLIAEATWSWTNRYQPPYEAYPTLIDRTSESMSFDTTGQFPDLYYARVNDMTPRDYDLVRVPLRFDR